MRGYIIYVYGRGLIGEEAGGAFETYHFDYRGSTVAITDINGNVTDRFEYDTYGKLTSRTGDSDVIFLYNGRDGVVTDTNGLIYMRARYYSPELHRFINADILAGDIANAVTLNRYAYANANPVSYVDPKGLAVERLLDPNVNWKDLRSEISSIFSEDAETLKSFETFFDFIESVTKGECKNPVAEVERLTMNGSLDRFLEVTLGAYKDADTGAYHIRQDWWQAFHGVGYNDMYDVAFYLGTTMSSFPMGDEKLTFGDVVSWAFNAIFDPQIARRKFEFTHNGEEYVIWAWKGDYINLGAGAELGIYKDSVIPGHYLTAPELDMPMSLILKDKETNKLLYSYRPEEEQWWITGFDPSTQGKTAKDLGATVTIDFSGNTDLMDSFRAGNHKGWEYSGTVATYTY